MVIMNWIPDARRPRGGAATTPDSPGSRRQRRQPDKAEVQARGIVPLPTLKGLVDVGPPWPGGRRQSQTETLSGGAQAIALRTTQNAVAHASHRCSTLITPQIAVTWLTGVIRWLAQEGHRRSRVSGSSGSGPPLRGASWHHGAASRSPMCSTRCTAGQRPATVPGSSGKGYLDDSADAPTAVAGLHAADPPTRYRCQISHASPTVGRRIATRVANASA